MILSGYTTKELEGPVGETGIAAAYGSELRMRNTSIVPWEFTTGGNPAENFQQVHLLP